MRGLVVIKKINNKEPLIYTVCTTICGFTQMSYFYSTKNKIDMGKSSEKNDD